MKNLLKKVTGWSILTVSVFIYAFFLSALCELAAHHQLGEIKDFLSQANVFLAVKNFALIIAFLILAITFLTRKLSIGVASVSIISYILFIVDGMKILFRNEPLYLTDLAVAGEAANVVMGNMTIKFNPAMIVGIIFILVAIAFSVFADIKLLKKIKIKYYYSIIPCAVAVISLFLVWNTLFSDKYLQANNLHVEEWNQLGSYKKNGLIYSLLSNSIKAKVTAPEGYSQETIEQIVQSTITDGSENVSPNIIIFMSEAYSDIENSKNITFSKDIDANYDKLSKNYLTGRCLTKQIGGGTANSEFEVLTGLSSDLIPAGVIAYTNYVKPGIPNIVSFLKENGYYTTASHPYIRSFFSRETAYAHMGFDEFHSMESFEGDEVCRNAGYFTDVALVDKIIELYEQNKSSGKPFFNHSVSMQNHMSFYPNEFTDENAVTINSSVELSDEEKGALETYASGMYLSDKALGKLTEYFENVDEPTVILYFGDHQPYIVADTYELFKRIGYLSEDELESQYKYYSTPYLIWNNFSENKEGSVENMSMFQLLPYMTDKLNMIRPDYYYFLNDYAKYCKGFSASVYLDGEGNPKSEQSTEEKQKTDVFKMLQYDLLHGEKYCAEKFY